MGITIAEIKDNDVCTFHCDVHVTGNIGKNAKITIKRGNLIVNGNVKDGAAITSYETDLYMQFHHTAVNRNIVLGSIDIKGNVGNRVLISAESRAISVNGSVGEHCTLKTHDGNIDVHDIGNDTKLKSQYGSIYADKTGARVRLGTYTGNVMVEHLGELCSATTYAGSVNLQYASNSAQLISCQGEIRIHGEKCGNRVFDEINNSMNLRM